MRCFLLIVEFGVWLFNLHGKHPACQQELAKRRRTRSSESIDRIGHGASARTFSMAIFTYNTVR